MKPPREEFRNSSRSRKRSAVVWMFLAVWVVSIQSSLSWKPWRFAFSSTNEFECPNNSYVFYVQSHFDKDKHDRAFYFDCEPLPNGNIWDKCFWTAWLYPQYKCSHQAFMAGAKNRLVGSSKDRQWAFKCCNRTGWTQRYNRETGLVPTRVPCNQDLAFRVTVPENNVLVAIKSNTRSDGSDRDYYFGYCPYP